MTDYLKSVFIVAWIVFLAVFAIGAITVHIYEERRKELSRMRKKLILLFPEKSYEPILDGLSEFLISCRSGNRVNPMNLEMTVHVTREEAEEILDRLVQVNMIKKRVNLICPKCGSHVCEYTGSILDTFITECRKCGNVSDQPTKFADVEYLRA